MDNVTNIIVQKTTKSKLIPLITVNVTEILGVIGNSKEGERYRE
jgi:hypothetical protein